MAFITDSLGGSPELMYKISVIILAAILDSLKWRC